jgi:hypothetical protein
MTRLSSALTCFLSALSCWSVPGVAWAPPILVDKNASTTREHAIAPAKRAALVKGLTVMIILSVRLILLHQFGALGCAPFLAG